MAGRDEPRDQSDQSSHRAFWERGIGGTRDVAAEDPALTEDAARAGSGAIAPPRVAGVYDNGLTTSIPSNASIASVNLRDLDPMDARGSINTHVQD